MKKLLTLLALLPVLALSASGDLLYEKTNIAPGTVHVFEADKTGTTDVTAKLVTFLQQGGYLIIPDGSYLIGYAGVDTGGAYATITNSIHVECAPNAKLIGTNLDNDIVRLQVPSNGAGLPTNGISIIWHGCYFDQHGQKTSTSVPFSGTYTSTNQGASATTDGLSIYGAYNSGTVHSGVYYLEVSGATFYAGSHWQNAGSGSGGDSGLLSTGVALSEIHGNYFYGNRDASIYMTNDSTGILDVRSDVYNNYMVNSFACVAVKRSSPGFSIHDNTCINGVVGFGVYWIVGAGDSEGEVHNNRCSGCQVNDRVDYSTNISVHDEKCDNFGAFLADGTTAVTAYTPVGLQLQGMTYSTIRNNVCTSISATYAALNPSFISLADFASVGPTASTNNRLEHNMSVGFHSIGGETGSADYNEFWENYEYTGSVHFPVTVGTHTSSTRYDYAAGTRAYMNPQYFDDGTVSAPMVARRGDTTTGMFFGSSKIEFAVGGTEYARLGTYWNTPSLSVSPIGTAQQVVATITPASQVIGAGAGVSSSLNGRFTADTSAASRYLFKSRNTTPGSFTTLTTGDCIGRDLFYGDDGTTYNSLAGEIDVCSTGTLSTGIIPGKYFLKLADSAGTLQTPMTATSAGVAFTGTVTPSTTSGIVGTTAADQPNAGSVGQVASVHCVVGAAAAAGTTVTMTIATPAVITWSSHTFTTSASLANYSCPINFTNSGGALPTGIVAGTTYYIIGSTVSGDTFQIADTAAHALASTNAVNTSGSQSGTQLGFIGAVGATGTTFGAAALQLVAGDWDCTGVSEFQELTSITATRWFSGVDSSINSTTIGNGTDIRTASGSIGAASYYLSSPVVRENVSATTTVYESAMATFTVGTMNVGGSLRCRRMR